MTPSTAIRISRTRGVRTSIRRAAALVLLLLFPVSLGAHAVVQPAEAPPGAYQRYVLRVPTEREVPTTRVEIQFPAAVTVVSFADVPGWSLEVMTDSAGRIVGAAWTGTLPPQRFVEFPFVAVNPREDLRIAWPVTQTYAGGEVVEWAGPEDSETPASVTVIAADSSVGWDPETWLVSAGLIISLLALGFALRPPRSRPAGA
ncbi:MAG TPA: DUF1775 domain-containing protein [Gemmatimonadota bacterium]|jgi:uncharacterized protein YcnI|nr:DUF1775 domain-containing protein [Gemmatimonadota bacterium]